MFEIGDDEVRKRNIKKQVWLNREEANQLKKKAKKVCLNEATLIRDLILGVELKEKPDERFYEAIKELRHIGNNLNQIAKKANYLNYVDSSKYGEEVNKLNSFIIRIKKEFLIGEKCD